MGKRKVAASRRKNGNGANLGFDAKLWLAADKLCNYMDAAEYKHVVLGLIFLKYISDLFEEMHQRLLSGEDNRVVNRYDEALFEEYGSSKSAYILTEREVPGLESWVLLPQQHQEQ